MEVCEKLARVDVCLGAVLHLDALAASHRLPADFVAKANASAAVREALSLVDEREPSDLLAALRREVEGGRGGFLIEAEQPVYRRVAGALAGKWDEVERRAFRGRTYAQAAEQACRWGSKRIREALVSTGLAEESAGALAA